MKNKFNIALDRYLTTEPVSDYFLWIDIVWNHFTSALPVSFEDSDVENLWMDKLYNSNKNPAEAAKIIERAFKIYEKQIIT